MMTINGDVMTFEPRIATKNLAVYQLAGLIMPSMAQGPGSTRYWEYIGVFLFYLFGGML